MDDSSVGSESILFHLKVFLLAEFMLFPILPSSTSGSTNNKTQMVPRKVIHDLFLFRKKRIAIHPHSPPQMHKKPWLRNQRISSIFSDFSFIKYTFHSSLFLYPSHYRMFSTVARSTARLANVCRPNLSRSFYAMMRNSQMSPSLLPRQTNSSVYIQKRYFMGNIMRVAIQVISSTFSASVRAFLSAFQQQAGISLFHLSPSILHPMSIPSTICWFSLILTNRVFSICSPFLSHPFFS